MKDIKNYIHLYIGCEIKIKNKVTKEWGKWRKVHFTECNLVVNYDAEAILKLRPWSSRTEAEEKEALDVWASVAIPATGPCPDVTLADAARIKWLLSKGFDLFGLIEPEDCEIINQKP